MVSEFWNRLPINVRIKRSIHIFGYSVTTHCWRNHGGKDQWNSRPTPPPIPSPPPPHLEIVKICNYILPYLQNLHLGTILPSRLRFLHQSSEVWPVRIQFPPWRSNIIGVLINVNSKFRLFVNMYYFKGSYFQRIWIYSERCVTLKAHLSVGS